jgi:hypothetical protein
MILSLAGTVCDDATTLHHKNASDIVLRVATNINTRPWHHMSWLLQIGKR